MQLAIDPFNPVAPQFMTHGLYADNLMNKCAGILIPATIVRRFLDVTHSISINHAVGQSVSVGDAVVVKSDHSKENYKTGFEIWR